MTDTSSPGATDGVFVRHLAEPLRLSPAEAEAAFQPRTLTDLGEAYKASQIAKLSSCGSDPDAVVIDASVLKPSLTALVRWAMTLLAAALVQHGLLSTGAADQLVPIGVGVALAGASLAWSIVQKRLASYRIRLAARTSPARVVLK